MIINIQQTPNPNALKFIVGMVWMHFVWSCNNEGDAQKSVLASKLWKIDGVEYLMFGRDFVSVSKRADIAWDILQPQILEELSCFLAKDIGLFDQEERSTDTATEGTQTSQELANSDITEYTELEVKIIQVLVEKVQPVLESHGGMVKFVGFRDGIVVLDMQGACKGCPSSSATLKSGIENLLKYYFSEVVEVVSA